MKYTSRKEMLKDLITPNSVIAEIGIFTGEFTQYIADTLKPSKLYAVDPYVSTCGLMGSADEHGFNMEYYNLEVLYGFVKNRFYKRDNVVLKRESSSDFFKSLEEPLDAIYIDGDHSPEIVMANLEEARYAVKENGYIMGHDYARHTTGNPEITDFIKDVVDKFCIKHGLTVYALAEDGIISYAIKNINKYKICIVSLSDRPALSDYTFPLMKTYANKHDYSLVLHTKLLCNRHPSWSKIPALQQELKKYDYVVWMDDDIYLTDLEKPLSFFIDTYGFRKSNATIMVSSDVQGEKSTLMNCGVLFLKPTAIPLLENVWIVGENNRLLINGFSWEQEAFNFCYKFTNPDAFMIVPQPNFQTCARLYIDPTLCWKPGHFAAHLNVGDVNSKLETMKLLTKLL